YRAEQSGDLALDAAWTNVTKILTPMPILDGALGEVVVVTNPSVSGDRQSLYFTYIERGKAPDDVEPPVNLADSVDDTDPLNPPTDVNVPMTDPVGLLIGDAPYWQNWRFTKGLAHPANYDAGSGHTTGWEDSINISADGRTLYFGYSPWILGQGLYAGPDYCADPFDSSCRVGRRVVPRILANGQLRSTGQAGGHANAGVGVNIFEATIGDHDSNSATPNEWIVTFSEVNFEHYCGTGSHPDCLNEDTVCLNDIYGEVLTAGDPLADPVIPKDAECFTSKDQGYNEGAVTVSTADDGVDHMVFVRYGDIAELVPSAPLTSPPETVSWRMYTSTRSCGTSGSGTGTHWCTPVKAEFTIDDSLYTSGDDEQYCDDNDPHL
ncbi:MAG: PD40 domain-containing protein, partial [Myxococcales bacterium]|nr:PD40 domain-containing protein [Myxococcales bacterium]